MDWFFISENDTLLKFSRVKKIWRKICWIGLSFCKYCYNIVSTWTVAICCSWWRDVAGNNLVVIVVVGQSHAFFCFALNTFKLPSKCSAGQQKRNGSHCFVSTVTSLQKFLFCLTTSHSFSLLSLSNLQFFFTITHDRASNMTFCFDEPEISKKNDIWKYLLEELFRSWDQRPNI